jgi:hypothetical protein
MTKGSVREDLDMTTEADSHPHRVARQLGPDAAERISAGCYGALVAATTLVEIGDVSVGKLVALVILTNVIYYVTHVFAYTIGDHSSVEVPPFKSLLHHLAVSAPMVSAVFAPLIVVLILRLAGVEHSVAALYGVGMAVLFLAVVATVGAQLRRLPLVIVIITPIVTIAVSVLLVAAKLSLH